MAGKFPKSILGIILVITTLLNIVASLVHSQQTLQYPKVKRNESVVDDYFGTIVKDPYRWLEERDSEQVSEFVGTQNELTFTYLSDCKQKEEFRERLHELWAYPKFGRPEKRGTRYFYFAQQRASEVLYVQENKEATPRALIDPQQNGSLAFPSFGVSRDGEFVVYKEVLVEDGFPRVSTNLRILNVSTGIVYPDVIQDVRDAQVAWDKNSHGFFYFSHKKSNESSEEEDVDENPSAKIYYHRIGANADEDVLAVDYFDFGNEPDFVDMETSVDGSYLLLRTRSYDLARQTPKTNSTFYIANLTKFQETGVTERLQLVPVITKRSTAFVRYVANIGTLFYFRSRINSKNYRLIEIDSMNPSEETWRVVVDANINHVLQKATAVDKSKVVLSYTSDKLNSYAELRDLTNGSLIRMFPLEFGELLSFSGNIDDSEILFRSVQLEGMPELFYFDARDPKGPMKRLVQPPELSHYDPSNFVAEVVTYPSTGGENIEMILLYRKDLKRDGSAYAFITEREFNLDFYFRTYFSYMKDFNAVVAFPHLEEEKGSGFRDTALDDFIAGARYLVQHGYSSGPRIIARGTNTAAIFAAAAANRHPELFGSMVISLAAFDMLRFDVATNSTAGLTEDAEDFNRTYGISPLHNIRLPANESVQYPGIFIPTTNAFPIAFSFKYLSELQYTLGRDVRQTNPFLMRVVPEPEKPTDSSFSKHHINKETDVLCFLEKTVGLGLFK